MFIIMFCNSVMERFLFVGYIDPYGTLKCLHERGHVNGPCTSTDGHQIDQTM